MKSYETGNLRNIGIIGHSGSGKTMFTESILYTTKAIDRLGMVEEGNTVSDYETEEKKRKISVATSIATCEWEDVKINIIDTPGYPDFIGEMIEGLRAVDVAVINVSGTSGVKVGTEKAWKYVNKIRLPRAFFINKLDRENSDFKKVLEQLKNKFGISVAPIQYPIGVEENFRGVINVITSKAKVYNSQDKVMEDAEIPIELIKSVEECKKMIMEAVAETDEELLEKYLSEGVLDENEIYHGLINGCNEGEIAPVMCGSSLKGIGIETVLEDIDFCFPSPKNHEAIKAYKVEDGSEVDVKINVNEPFCAIVFKTIADPFVGKLSIFKVMSGKIKNDTFIYNSNKNKEEKIGNLYFLRGKTQIPTKEVIAGDIGAVSKLMYTSTGDTICDPVRKIAFKNIEYPIPNMAMAVIPKNKGDEDKISSGLNKLLEEDPTFKIERDLENAEVIIKGLGETHLEIIGSKLKSKFGTEVILNTPKIPYRETIVGIADVQGKHKKQSGGHGQYGDVVIKFEKRKDGEDELLFVDEVVGGAVPRQYIPAVEKGLRECVAHGVLAGYPVIKLSATLHDGSYHPVDSSEMAFKVAASLAFKKGLEEAKSVLLEPIMQVEVIVPPENMGEVIADINKKRGKVLGMENYEDFEKVIAEVPEAEMFKYATDLKSLTATRGSYSLAFKKYEEVPEIEAKKIIEKAKNID